MQLTIKLPDLVPNDKVLRLIKEIEDTFPREGIVFEIEKDIATSEDSWDNLDVSTISVDTGIEDFAENHDHYLYGLPKRS